MAAYSSSTTPPRRRRGTIRSAVGGSEARVVGDGAKVVVVVEVVELELVEKISAR